MVERVERMIDDVRAFKLVPGLGQDARTVECDIAGTNDCGMASVKRRIEIGEIGMAIVTADELSRAHDAGQIFSRNAEPAVMRRADR
jgi:hypothetical protein